ncbi:MAG: hypothetical protein ACTHLO_14135, partial [Pseudolabrys sp.]
SPHDEARGASFQIDGYDMLSRFACTIAVAVACATPAFAEDGCGKFAWPLAHERELLSSAAPASAGDTLQALPRAAIALRLAASNEAKFAMPPERKPKATSWFGGALMLPAPAKAGLYQVTLSDEAWLDVVQDGRYARSVGSTGRRDCPGVRKSVRFELSASPFVLQVSGGTSDRIALTIAPVP